MSQEACPREAIQTQFEEQQAQSDGDWKDKEKPEPLMTMSQWKELLETSEKAFSLPPTPAKVELFTAACEEVNATPRQILQLASPATAASTNTTQSVSTTRTEVVAALKANLSIADNHNMLSLSSGYTVPVDAERVIKQAALNCAEKYFDDEEKDGLPILNAMMPEFSISSRAKKTNTTVGELLRACVTQGVNVSREELGI